MSQTHANTSKPLSKLLKPFKKTELLRLFDYLEQHHPDTRQSLERYLQGDTEIPENQSSAVARLSLNVTVDLELYERLMYNAVKASEINWDGYPEYDEVYDLITKVSPFLARGDYGNAFAIAETFVDTFVSAASELDDETGLGGASFSDESLSDDLDYILAEAILGVKPSQSERKRLMKQILLWQKAMINDWSDPTFDCSAAALLQDIKLDDKEAEKLAQAMPELREYNDDIFTAMQLRVMEHTDAGNEEKQLEFAKTSGQGLSYLKLLLKFNQHDKAMQEYKEQLEDDRDKLEFVRALHDAYPEDALALIRESFAGYMPHGFADLVKAERLSRHNENARLDMAQLCIEMLQDNNEEPELRYQAQQLVFRYQPTIERYCALEAAAGEEWQELRAALLKFMRRANYERKEAAIDILLYEKMHEQAIRYVSEERDDRLTKKVMGVVMPDFPQWVIGVATHKAEELIEATKSQYYPQAVEWLSIVKDTHKMHGTELEWERYIIVTAEQHKRKRNFIKELQTIYKMWLVESEEWRVRSEE